jgi:hypothetical protein
MIPHVLYSVKYSFSSNFHTERPMTTIGCDLHTLRLPHASRGSNARWLCCGPRGLYAEGHSLDMSPEVSYYVD